MDYAAIGGAAVWSAAAVWLRLGAARRRAASRIAFGCLFLAGIAASGLVGDAVARYWRAQTAIPYLAFVLCALLTSMITQWAVRPRLAAPPVHPPEPAGPGPGGLYPTAQFSTARFPTAEFPTAQFPVAAPTGPQPDPGSAGRNPHPRDLGVRETYSVGGNMGGTLTLLAFAALSLAGAITSLRTHSQSSNAAAALFIGLPTLVLIAILVNILLRRRLPRRLVLRGRVARLWTVVPDAARRNVARNYAAPTGNAGTPELYYCLLHSPLDGVRAPEGVRLKLNQTVYQRLYEGQLIEVLVNPRRHRIKDLRSVDEAG